MKTKQSKIKDWKKKYTYPAVRASWMGYGKAITQKTTEELHIWGVFRLERNTRGFVGDQHKPYSTQQNNIHNKNQKQ